MPWSGWERIKERFRWRSNVTWTNVFGVVFFRGKTWGGQVGLPTLRPFTVKNRWHSRIPKGRFCKGYKNKPICIYRDWAVLFNYCKWKNAGKLPGLGRYERTFCLETHQQHSWLPTKRASCVGWLTVNVLSRKHVTQPPALIGFGGRLHSRGNFQILRPCQHFFFGWIKQSGIDVNINPVDFLWVGDEFMSFHVQVALTLICRQHISI